MEYKKQIEAYKRQLLADLLSQCTEPQKELFNRIYPSGVPENKLENALGLCERTVKKNQTRLTEKQ